MYYDSVKKNPPERMVTTSGKWHLVEQELHDFDERERKKILFYVYKSTKIDVKHTILAEKRKQRIFMNLFFFICSFDSLFLIFQWNVCLFY